MVHFKSDFVLMDWSTLKEEFKKMYGVRQNPLQLRKKLGKRRWKAGELFSDYFHEKVRLGNIAAIPEIELIQYAIDRFDNKSLQKLV